MKKKFLKKPVGKTPVSLVLLSQKCDVILLNLNKVLSQIQKYPKTFADCIENLYTAADELSEMINGRGKLNR